MRYFIAVFTLVTAFTLLYFWRCEKPIASAQQPRRWQSGDTLWYEIDSVPYLPSASPFADSMNLGLYDINYLHDRTLATSPQHEQDGPIKFEYKLPYWNIYRRSITVWGITFSTGQPDPFVPYPQAVQSADVLSMPLPKK